MWQFKVKALIQNEIDLALKRVEKEKADMTAAALKM
jgi:hypothetical protein